MFKYGPIYASEISSLTLTKSPKGVLKEDEEVEHLSLALMNHVVSLNQHSSSCRYLYILLLQTRIQNSVKQPR